MKRYNKNIPDGTADTIFDDTLYIRKAVETFGKVYESLNYSEVMTPAMEYYDVFDFGGQPIPQEMMYKMTDGGGRLLVLRPDNTTPIARVVSTKLKDKLESAGCLKICYNQNVFRVNGGYSGKKSETIQSGVEIIGAHGIKADICCIETALRILKSTGLNFKLEIGHAGFGKSLKETAVISHLFGGHEVIEEARAFAEGNKEAGDVLDYICRLYEILDSAGYGGHIIIDLGIVHEIDYYTGIVIGGYVDGVGESVLAGGRYDNLIANFGPDLPAVGFAANVNLIAKALEASEEENYEISKINKTAVSEIVHYDAADYSKALNYIDAKKITDKDVRIELSCFETPAETVKYAAENGIKKVVAV